MLEPGTMIAVTFKDEEPPIHLAEVVKDHGDMIEVLERDQLAGEDEPSVYERNVWREMAAVIAIVNADGTTTATTF